MSSTLNTADRPPLSASQVLLPNGGVMFAYDDADEDGQDLVFVEEPCGVLAQHGFGYIQAEFGERIGPFGRYEILRKFGFGMNSSVWLAKDHLQNCFVSIKVLTGYVTFQVKERAICELDVLQRISNERNDVTDNHCLSLLSHFVQPEKEAGEGEHLCLVTKPLGPSIEELIYNQEPSILCVKKMLRDVLKGLAYIHALGIVHTDIQAKNILAGIDGFDIESYIKKDPSRRHPPEQTFGNNKFIRVAVSQPFPVEAFTDWRSRSFVISDFGSAQFLDQKVTDRIAPIQMRAPETILGLPWDEKVDIWSFGCLAYQCLAGPALFNVLGDGSESDPAKLILHQILSFTGERLSAETIHSSKRGTDFLNPETGLVMGDMPHISKSLSDAMRDIRIRRADPAIDGFEVLLQKCLRLDPKDRPSANELLKDIWLNSNA